MDYLYCRWLGLVRRTGGTVRVETLREKLRTTDPVSEEVLRCL